MLDKDTVTRQATYKTKMDQGTELDQKPREHQEIDSFQECVNKAKEHVDDESVKECFDKAKRLKKNL
ncbi:MAG: hypothetical protein V5A76_03920 [Candidatus Thermoplasmatota archaeon]